MSEFVFGTHNAAFVQVMYEQYLRDPASVGEEWRNLFDNGKVAELPVIPASREEVQRDTGHGTRETEPRVAAGTTSPVSRVPSPGLTPITGPAARLVQNMTDSLSVPTATSFREIRVEVLDARRRELNAQLAASGKKVAISPDQKTLYFTTIEGPTGDGDPSAGRIWKLPIQPDGKPGQLQEFYVAQSADAPGGMGFAKSGDRLQGLAAMADGGVDFFVVHAAQIGAPLLVNFAGPLLDGEFVRAPDQHYRG